MEQLLQRTGPGGYAWGWAGYSCKVLDFNQPQAGNPVVRARLFCC